MQDLQQLQKANARLKLSKEQSAWDAATYKAKLERKEQEAESARQLKAGCELLSTEAAEHKAQVRLKCWGRAMLQLQHCADTSAAGDSKIFHPCRSSRCCGASGASSTGYVAATVV